MTKEEIVLRGSLERLRQSNRRLLRQLADAKAQRRELVEAVYKAAYDAASALEIDPVSPPKPDTRRKTSEVAVAVLSDLQLAKKTATYNSVVCAERVARYADKVMELTRIQRADHPVRECRVYLLGDWLEGELVFPGQAWALDSSLYEQILVTGRRILVDFIRQMLQEFERVHVVGVAGNHGSLGGRARREYHPESNADMMLYETARLVLKGHDDQLEPRLTWHPNRRPGLRAWYAVDTIGRHGFLLFHGDQIRGGYADFPWYGFGKKILRWSNGGINEKFTYALCVSEDTEALTPTGWKRYHDIVDGEPLAALDPSTGLFQWELPSRINVYNYSGDLIRHRSDCVDHLATADHLMWTRLNGSPWQRRKSVRVGDGNWRFKHAADEWSGHWFWHGPIDGDSFDLAEFVGWYVSEGHVSTHQVSIAQKRSRHPENYARIVALIKRLGLRPSLHPLQVRICSTEIAKWVRSELGVGCRNKRLPFWVRSWPKPMLKRLVEVMVLGDGHRQGPESFQYYTTSRLLADDFQEACMKLGWSSAVSSRQRPNRMGLSYTVEVVQRTERRAPHFGPTREGYVGNVWCPTLPSGLWFSRRNGRVVVTGNSGHFHTPGRNLYGRVRHWASGSTESSNEYAAERIGNQGDPSQWLLFVHPERGVTAEYEVHLL